MPGFYRKNFHSPTIIEEDFEFRLTEGISVVYRQSNIAEKRLLLKSKVKLSEVVAGAMTLGPIHSLYESMMRTNKIVREVADVAAGKRLASYNVGK
jgi:hypothetical protein